MGKKSTETNPEMIQMTEQVTTLKHFLFPVFKKIEESTGKLS